MSNPSLDNFFENYPDSQAIFSQLLQIIQKSGETTIKVSKSQVAFVRRIPYVWTWVPARYLRSKSAPLVLSIAFHKKDASLRWKEIVEPNPGRFMHHLELWSTEEIDDQVQQWIKSAWDDAG